MEFIDNLSFNVQQDQGGVIWTANNTSRGPLRYTFKNLEDVAETFFEAGIAWEKAQEAQRKYLEYYSKAQQHYQEAQTP